MANENVKYLSYDGLKHYDAKLKDFILKGFANGISVTQVEEKNIISLTANYEINNVATTSILATATINLATANNDGFMSKEDFSKLDGIEAGAEVNQNAFSKITIGSTTITADQKTDTLTIVAGDNITLTPDAGNDKITIAAKDTVYVHNNYTANTVTAAGTAPTFGGTFEAFSEISNDSEGHVTKVTKKSVTIPSLPNVTVTDKGNTAAASAGNTTVEVVKTVANGTTASATNVYLDFTTVEVPTKTYVDNAISSGIAKNDAMHYRGTVTSAVQVTTLSKSCEIGDTYRIATAFGSYEVGDMLIFDKDGSTSTPATYSVIQNNIDGAVYNTSTQSVIGNFAAFDSNTGKVIKDSGYNSDSFATASHGHNIAATGSGDSVITVVPNGGNLSVDYKVTHKEYTSATFTQGVKAGKPGTSVQFNVPNFTVDGYGHVSEVSSSAITVSLPAYPTALKSPTGMTISWKDSSGTDRTITYDGSAFKEINLTSGIYYAATSGTAQYSATAGHAATAGFAITADKLNDSSVGATNRPVFFHNGQPTQCAFTVATSVPANAKFTDTDTKNTAGTVSTSSAQLYIVGAKFQQADAETYSSPNAYIGSDNKLYAIGSASTTVTSVITCNDAITIAEINALF